MGPRLVGTVNPSTDWTPERFDPGGPRSGVRRVKRKRLPISAQMRTVSTPRETPQLSPKMLRSRLEAAADMGGSVVGTA